MDKNRILIIALAVMVALNLGLSSFMFFRVKGKHQKQPKCAMEKEFQMHKEGMEPGNWEGHKREDRMGFMKDRMSRILGFSEEQKKALEEIQDKHFEQMKANKEKENATREKLLLLLSEDKINSVVKDSLIKELAANKQEMSLSFFDHFESIKGLCTEEQKSKFDTLISEMKNKMRHHPMPD